MERKGFLSLMGFGSAYMFAAICLGGCSKTGASSCNVTAPTNVYLIQDLTLPANAALANGGGYLYFNGHIVVHTISCSYSLLSQVCAHQGVAVQYKSARHEYYFPSHGATFFETGAEIAGLSRIH
jgi:hypothetical protein